MMNYIIKLNLLHTELEKEEALPCEGWLFELHYLVVFFEKGAMFKGVRFAYKK